MIRTPEPHPGGSPPRRGSRAPRLLLALIAAGAGIAAIAYQLRPRGEASYAPRPVTPAGYVTRAESLPSHIRFVDVTEEAGIRFHHFNGARGKRLLPETMGGGCAFVDFDGDGDQDIVLVNGAPWPGEEEDPPPTQALYENDGRGRFTDVTAERGLAVTFYGMGIAAGDYDNDGWEDLFFTAVGPDRLFRNVEGRRFEETTAAAGLDEVAGGLNGGDGGDGAGRPSGSPYPRSHHSRSTGAWSPGAWSTGAAFLDYDLDGRLDLFVCRYVEWSPEIDLAQDFQITGIGRAYGPPQNFAGVLCRLWRNIGGRFEDVSAAAGIEVLNRLTGKPMAKSLGVAVHDMDEDGYPDIAVANDTVQNFLFHNRGDGTFEEVGAGMGFAFDPSGNTRGAMGIDWADHEAPGAKAIVVGNFANEVTALYRSPDPTSIPFRDDAIAQGIGNPSRKFMKFGVFFFDLDLDGRLDIFEANGHIEQEISTVQTEQTHEQPAQVFWRAPEGSPRGYEVLGRDHLGPDLFRPMVGRGAAYADIDGDGDLDILCSPNGTRARLFRNDGGDQNGWIRLRLAGTRANRSALGARLEVRVGERVLKAQLTSGRSYLSQCERVITFGIGEEPEARNVRIHWPGQREPQILGTIPARTARVVVQP